MYNATTWGPTSLGHASGCLRSAEATFVGTLDIAGGLCYPIHRTGTRSANDSTRFQGLANHSEVVFYVRGY